MKGFKVFISDWTCRDFQYKVGETYVMEASPVPCTRGFHFCENLADCFSYYSFDPNNKVAEIEAIGDIASVDGGKSCTNKITIVREMTWEEVLQTVNTGKGCTGLCNTGDRNTGNRNTGNRNTGDCNTGDWNTGDWNAASFSSGCFCTEEPRILMFDEPSDMTYRDWINSRARYLLNTIPKRVVEWIYSSDMTDEEKAQHPEYETTGGYLKVLDESECAQVWWDGLGENDRDFIRSIPNFNAKKFEKCTGIKVGD